MATYVVNTPGGLFPRSFFIESADVTRGAGPGATATTLTYTLLDGRTVVVTGTGFTYDAQGIPTGGSITAVQLFDGLFELAAFTEVSNRPLKEFDTRWLSDNDPFGVFHVLLPGADVLIGGDGDDGLAPGLGNDVVDGGTGGIDEVVYRNHGRTVGVTVDLNSGDASDELGRAWSGLGATPPAGGELDILVSIENVFGTRFDDRLIGDTRDNTFTASGGDDTVSGGDGFDELRYDRGASPSAGIVVAFTGESTGSVTGGGADASTGAPIAFGTDTFDGIEAVLGTDFADAFTGSSGSQRFRGLGGNDSFDGGDGEDEVDFSRDVGNLGVTVDLVGGTATGPGGSDTLVNIESIRGTANDDSITGNGVANRLRGEAGNDTLTGGGDGDSLDGGDGNDTLSGDDGDDILVGGLGDDTLNGGADFDEADYSRDTVPVAVKVDLSLGTALRLGVDSDVLIGIENVRGTNGNDTLIGNAGLNQLFGEGGDDLLNGGQGADTLVGGAGRDIFIGMQGVDIFIGAGDGDIGDYASEFGGTQGILANLGSTAQAGLVAGTVRDSFGFVDVLFDVYNLTGTQYQDRIYGGIQANRLLGGGGDDFIFGHDGNDVLDGGNGNDTLDGGNGNDALTGGAGNDAYYVDLGDTVAELAGSGTDTVFARTSFTLASSAAGVEGLRAATASATTALNLTANALNNTVVGNNGVNVLSGLDGNDTLHGLGGDDTLDGGNGNDTMIGGAGHDSYYVNGGDIVIEAAGAGTDTVFARTTFTLGPAAGGVEVLAAAAASATTALSLTANALNNTVIGNNGVNALSGLDGDDTLLGLAGNDTLIGGVGRDTLVGGLGRDTLVGGSGNDLFDFNLTTESAVGANRDVVYFGRIVGTDVDKIDLSTIDAIAATAANEAFTFRGTGAFTAAGQIRFDAAAGVLQGNVGGTLAADFEIKIVGVTSMVLADFVL